MSVQIATEGSSSIQKRLARKLGKPYFSRFKPNSACGDETAYVALAQQEIEKLIASLTEVKQKMGDLAKQERTSIEVEMETQTNSISSQVMSCLTPCVGSLK